MDKRRKSDKRKPVKVYIKESYLKKLKSSELSCSEQINIALKKYLSEKKKNRLFSPILF